ncbi:Uncharacterised protein [Alysiella crassa]|uniref:Uncharacterized protein n=1 Tax=Alysiella crassa TaxID=153491 RepID=A0A376BL13_9NEIS|nr:Uncharacterised protein [Alysiella crassa]
MRTSFFIVLFLSCTERLPEKFFRAIGLCWHGFSTARVAYSANHSLWRNNLLRGTSRQIRQSESRPRGGCGKWAKQGFHYRAVPPRDWQQRQTHRLRRRFAAQTVFIGFRIAFRLPESLKPLFKIHKPFVFIITVQRVNITFDFGVSPIQTWCDVPKFQ